MVQYANKLTFGPETADWQERLNPERMRSERVFGAETRVRTLEARAAELGETIRSKTAQRTELALKLGVTTFNGKEENPYDRVLADLRSSLAEARRKRFEAEARLKAFDLHGETDITSRSVQEAVRVDLGIRVDVVPVALQTLPRYELKARRLVRRPAPRESAAPLS